MLGRMTQQPLHQALKKLKKHLFKSSAYSIKMKYVNLFVKDASMKKKVATLLQSRKVDLKRIRFFEFGYADVWFRDYGPFSLSET